MKKDTWKFIIQTVAAILTAIATSLGKDTWKFIIQTVAAILTAIATSLGVTSCIC